MDLYDDLDTKQRPGQIDGWSSGIKMLQTQLAIKKATLPPPRRDPPKRATILAPVINLKTKKDPEDNDNHRAIIVESSLKPRVLTTTITKPLVPVGDGRVSDYDWEVVDEYDPLWPNEYEKLVKDKREKDTDKREVRGKEDRDRKRRNSRFGGGGGGSGSATVSTGGGGGSVSVGGSNASSGTVGGDDSPPPNKYSGFASRVSDEDSYSRSPPAATPSRTSGVAIAPPPSLQEESTITINNSSESSSNVTIPYGASSVAAKIMAKYGFKDGQGLGKQEQGMSMALQVEKTSKRGGRIIHEKELIMLPPPLVPSPPLPTAVPAPNESEPSAKSELSITEIMKSPSKVVLLRNMVGPGDVDNELEPEVKDECNTKYGNVVSVLIHEVSGVPPEDAVRIFVEFKRIESAIKAVVDLNGRFFGGRQVRAGFYNFDKFKNLQLTD